MWTRNYQKQFLRRNDRRVVLTEEQLLLVRGVGGGVRDVGPVELLLLLEVASHVEFEGHFWMVNFF